MFHHLAKNLTEVCLCRNWITQEQTKWCIYVVEKYINILSTCLITGLLAIVLGKPLETLLFTAAFTLLRRRIGGWHAPKAWICQTVGFLVSWIVVFLIGPWLEGQPFKFTVMTSVAVLVVAFAARPLYPAQLRYSLDIVRANNRKKNRYIMVLTFIQALSCLLSKGKILVYLTLGIAVSLLSLYLEFLKQRGAVTYEEN